MRIAAISDVHGNVFALRAVLDAIAEDEADVVVNLGDHLSGGVAPAATADLLLRTPMVSVSGNHERQVLTMARGQMGKSDRLAHDQLDAAHREWLAGLPTTVTITEGVLAFHGSPKSDLEYLLETVTPDGVRPATVDEVTRRLAGYLDHDLLLCGHTHLQRAIRLDGGPLVVNPGSVGWPAYDDDNPFPHVVEAGSPHARYAIVDDATGRWEVDFRALDYPWNDAAALARSNGRPDVEHALLTGTNLSG
ncbi:metallophosphoesterase family protein [Myceligenerans pegani]|uniref:Metallophosphoesterase family protein n=1 Tax=Myceligenerans pegani TaxID=2776917 RepID=A0ABR9MSP7_9MICO|nr:metallophosphoesterase family protein [Myceligenerans sp. TRM 65318]MBE1874379.1 metallophosphoesterase family protein [Myceligenerans sp. TRM 65318]MBE3016650.1 metallophosphoesterase family protein [Myceligenerans sp. TRM 65318]